MDQIQPSGMLSLTPVTTYIHWKDWCWSSNTLAAWHEEPTHWKRPWCWDRLKAGGEGVHRWLGGITNSMDMNWSKLREMVKDREAWRSVVCGVRKSRTWLSDWTMTAQPRESSWSRGQGRPHHSLPSPCLCQDYFLYPPRRDGHFPGSLAPPLPWKGDMG